jgi:hypothetical protein
MIRDRFGAKDPKHRNSGSRSLEFDIEKVKDHLENYRKDKTPTRISCYQKIGNSVSNDSIGKDLFNDFFTFDMSSLINNEEYTIKTPHNDTLNEDKTLHHDDETNTMGFPRTVTAVTAVTNKNTSEIDNYTRANTVSQSIYRFYETGDIWGCNNCMDKGDKWYMLKHKCRMNKK